MPSDVFRETCDAPVGGREKRQLRESQESMFITTLSRKRPRFGASQERGGFTGEMRLRRGGRKVFATLKTALCWEASGVPFPGIDPNGR